MLRELVVFACLTGCAPTSVAPAAAPPAPAPVHVSAPEPEPAPQPESERVPVTALRVCHLKELDRVLAPLPKQLERPELGPPSLADLEPVPMKKGKLGELEHGPAFFGSHDFDADGRTDRVLLYTSVDYWLWLVLVDRGGCHELVGEVEGYQVESGKKDASGFRELAAWSYPLMGKRVRYLMSSKGYALVP